MKILVVYVQRSEGYDRDWISAFEKLGAQTTTTPVPFTDLTIIQHSMTAKTPKLQAWVVEEAQRRKGKLVFFPGNEYKWWHEKNDEARKIGADVIATQMPLESAQDLYQHPVIEVPHALNPDVFRPQGRERIYDIGVLGHTYNNLVGDEDRNRICSPDLWRGLKADIRFGQHLVQDEWAAALNTWRTMPSCEGASVDSKCITPRHFDAIGCHTCLVMYPGYYNGILTEEHYIRLEKDHSNLAEVKERIRDRAACERMVSRARDYLADSHTYIHRAKKVIEWALATG